MPSTIPVGIAEIDITPDYPVRLSGYGARRDETTRVETPLRAKALAIGNEQPALLITLENCGVTNTFTTEIAKRLRGGAGLPEDRLTICYSHTHTGPCLTGAAPMLFSTDIPPGHQKNIDRYTRELLDKLVEIGLAALTEQKPAYLSWTQGHAGFAANRRNQVGPVDHVMPMMRITDAEGNLKAVWLSYACHCTTLGSEANFTCGDWAGFAQDRIERTHPGVMTFVSIGCAADANPFPRCGLAYARQHGDEIATEVDRLLSQQFTSLSGEPVCRQDRIDLPFDIPPTLEEWREKEAAGGPAGYHAGKWLTFLDRGGALPATYSFPIQTWTFGDDLTMVFLAGEVVADYPIRMRRLYDPAKLWIGAYANDFPGYVPSRRVWQEGGYEGGDATVYFGLVNRFSEDIEDRIFEAVGRLIPSPFLRENE